MIDFFYDLAYMLPLNIVSTLTLLTYLGRQENSILGCLVSSFVIILALTLRHTGKKERFLIGGVVIAAMLGLYWVLGEEKRTVLYERFGFLLWIIAIAFICIIVGRLAQDYLWLKIVVSLLLIANVVYLMVGKIEVSGVTIAASWLVILIYLAELVQVGWEKSGYTDLKSHIALITPVILLIFILGCLLPAPDDPFDWRLAKNIWKMTVTEYKRITGYLANRNDEYKYTGFTEDATVAGAVASNGDGKEVMLIYTDDRSFDRLYMGGITFEKFVANGWETELKGEDNYRQFDLLETRAAIAKYNQGYEREYIAEDTIEVESRLFNTRHVFLPIKSNLDTPKTVIPKYKETEENVVTNSRIRYGDLYSLSYYRLNFANEELIALIDSAQAIEEEEWNSIIRKAAVSDKEDCSYENYQAYRNAIYQKYLTAIQQKDGAYEGISPELQAVIDEVTAGIEGDYERLKALSDYLQTMDYNTHPGVIPTKVTNASQYLDYFILESRTGYCVHYATAMTLLARACGYPARYVQGYYVKKNSKTNEVLVTEKYAHSWAEVYFDNFGWVTFEATPGYSVSKGWNVGSKVDASGQMGYIPHAAETETSETAPLDEIPQQEVKKEIHISYIVIPVFLAVFFGAAYLFINQLVTKHKYRKMNLEEKVRFLIQRNLRILKLLGYPISAKETIEEFRGRVVADIESHSEEVTDQRNTHDAMLSLSFLKLYEKLIYSDYECSDDDVTLMEHDYELLKNEIRTRGFRYRFYIL